VPKIQYASDLHLEYPKNREYLEARPLEPVGDILVLAGDIVTDQGRAKIEHLYTLWRSQFKYIISIPGNHEFYGGDAGYAYPALNEKLAPNHYLINNATIELEGVRFVASILWTHGPEDQMKKLERASNDYRLIRYTSPGGSPAKLTAAHVGEFHMTSLRYLESELKKHFTGKTVVITHHLPSYNLMGLMGYTGILKYYCASNLNRLIKDTTASYWIFGHFHQTIQKELFGTKFVSNPLGYMTEGQYEEFSPTACFEV